MVWNLPHQVYDQIEWIVKSSRLPEWLCLPTFFIDNFNEMSCLLIPPKSLLQDLDLTSPGLHNLKVSIPRRSKSNAKSKRRFAP